MTTSTISCKKCMSMLGMVISDMLAGLSMQLNHPYVDQHLQTCIDCRQTYQEVQNTLQRETAGRPPDPDHASWYLSLSPLSPAPWKSLHCFIPQAHLEALITAPPPPSHTRFGTPVGQIDWLLMADAIRRAPATIAVQVSLQNHWTTPEQLTLMAELSSDHPLPHPLEANLTWGDVARTQSVDTSGQVHFSSLPVAVGEPPI